MGKQVFQQWYWGDWFGDANVARLEPSARCVWFELLGIMHQNNTSSISDDIPSLARATRVRENIVGKALKKIAEKEVAEVTENDGIFTIVSRRLSREQAQKQQKSERQRRWRDGAKDGDVDAHIDSGVDAHETPKKRCTRARYSETHIIKENIIKENPGIESEIAVAAEKIFKRHPRRSDYRASVLAICQAVWDEVESGVTPEMALEMIAQKTDAYADAVKKWPPAEQEYVKGALAWYKNGCYRDDPDTWDKGDHERQSGAPEVVL